MNIYQENENNTDRPDRHATTTKRERQRIETASTKEKRMIKKRESGSYKGYA